MTERGDCERFLNGPQNDSLLFCVPETFCHSHVETIKKYEFSEKYRLCFSFNGGDDIIEKRRLSYVYVRTDETGRGEDSR